MTEPSLTLLLFLFSCISKAVHIHSVLCTSFWVIVLTRPPGGRGNNQKYAAWRRTKDGSELATITIQTRIHPETPKICPNLVLNLHCLHPGHVSSGALVYNYCDTRSMTRRIWTGDRIRIRDFALRIDLNDHVTHPITYHLTRPEKTFYPTHTSHFTPTSELFWLFMSRYIAVPRLSLFTFLFPFSTLFFHPFSLFKTYMA